MLCYILFVINILKRQIYYLCYKHAYVYVYIGVCIYMYVYIYIIYILYVCKYISKTIAQINIYRGIWLMCLKLRQTKNLYQVLLFFLNLPEHHWSCVLEQEKCMNC